MKTALSLAAVVLGVLLAGSAAAQKVGKSEIGGVVSGPNGPEAGVWVIAETTDLPTKFAKVVVTDDKGRYLIPQLPKAGYEVWVRGYGISDTQKIKASAGKTVNFTASASSAKEE